MIWEYRASCSFLTSVWQGPINPQKCRSLERPTECRLVALPLSDVFILKCWSGVSSEMFWLHTLDKFPTRITFYVEIIISRGTISVN